MLKGTGQREPFDRDKLLRSMMIALRKRPVDPDRVERVVNGIVRRLESSGESEIPTKLIGEMVMDALASLDPVAYVRFASVYRNFREARDFEAFIDWQARRRRRLTPPTSIDMRAGAGPGAARAGAGRPNPAVGCVIARGRAGGRPRLDPAGRPAPCRDRGPGPGRRGRAGATAYVTLEPCAHQGKTPPCDRALIAAGIARCVVALEDPDPRVAGQGIAKLREAGIAVETGLCRAGSRGGERRLSAAPARGPAAGRAQAGQHPGRPHRDRRRREPLDHRPGRARRAHLLLGAATTP